MTIKRYLPVGLLVALVGAVFLLHLDQYLSLETLRTHREALRDGVAAYGLLSGLGFVALYAVVVALSLPGGAVMTISGGFLFGSWLGGGLSMIGATIGATLLFIAARSAVGDGLRRRSGPFWTEWPPAFNAMPSTTCCFCAWYQLFPFGRLIWCQGC